MDDPFGQVRGAAGRGLGPRHSRRPSASWCSSRSTARSARNVDGSGPGPGDRQGDRQPARHDGDGERCAHTRRRCGRARTGGAVHAALPARQRPPARWPDAVTTRRLASSNRPPHQRQQSWRRRATPARRRRRARTSACAAAPSGGCTCARCANSSGQRGVLGQQAGVRARREVAGQRARHAVAADPALRARLFDHAQRALRIEAHAFGQGQRLGRAGEVDGREQVVDEFGARAVAHAARRRAPGATDSQRSSGSCCANTASAHATIRLIEPSRARCGPPDIGASMQATWSRCSRAAKRSTSCGAIVGHSITVEPLRQPAGAPPAAEQHRRRTAPHRPPPRSPPAQRRARSAPSAARCAPAAKRAPPRPRR